MLRHALSALIVTATAVFAACGGEEGPDTSDVDVGALLSQAAESMAGLRSYHADVRFGDEAEAVGIDFAWWDGHFYMDAHSEPEADLLSEAVVESMSLAVLGPSPSHVPHWSIVALSMAEDAEVIEAGETNGVPSVHVRARVNHLRAILESHREVAAGAGISTFARSCEGDEPDGCRTLSFKELLALQEPELSFYDDSQTVVDVWVGADDRLARRIELAIPPFDASDGATLVTFEFSRFDEVEPPGTPVLPPVR